MLDIYIYEKDPKTTENLKEICIGYLIERNWEASIYCSRENAGSAATALYVLRFDSETEELSGRIRGENSQNYIVVSLECAEDLLRAVRPEIKPSGYFIKPFKKAEVYDTLDGIMRDYSRCIDREDKLGIFHFQIKARCYSIPYDQIVYFESRRKKIAVRTRSQEFEFYGTLDSIRAAAPSCFVQIHKSYIVNLEKIVSVNYGDMSVKFDDGTTALISRTYKENIKGFTKDR